MLGRRHFLRMIGVGAVAAPAASKIALKELSEESMSKLSAISQGVGYAGSPGANGSIGAYNVPAETWTKHLRNKVFRAQLEDLLWEKHKQVCFIDPDLACMKSFSLNAKIAFQRRKNVERELKDFGVVGDVWSRIAALPSKAFSMFLGTPGQPS